MGQALRSEQGILEALVKVAVDPVHRWADDGELATGQSGPVDRSLLVPAAIAIVPRSLGRFVRNSWSKG